MDEKEYQSLIENGLARPGLGHVHWPVQSASSRSVAALGHPLLAAPGLWFGSGLAQPGKSPTFKFAGARQRTDHHSKNESRRAGLATRPATPLNIIRGLAQMISKQPPSPEIRPGPRHHRPEADKVAAQLNEFITIPPARSRLRPPARLARQQVVGLTYDLEEKPSASGQDAQLSVEPMNNCSASPLQLALNASRPSMRPAKFKSSPKSARFRRAALESATTAPVFPPTAAEIFKPYFTTQKQAPAGLPSSSNRPGPGGK